MSNEYLASGAMRLRALRALRNGGATVGIGGPWPSTAGVGSAEVATHRRWMAAKAMSKSTTCWMTICSLSYGGYSFCNRAWWYLITSITAAVITEVETPNIRMPLAASIGPSMRHCLDMTMSP